MADKKESIQDEFVFEAVCKIRIKADSISHAVEQLKEQQKDSVIKNVWKNGEHLNTAYSMKHFRSVNGNIVYYPVGCPCGKSDCGNDPMHDIAVYCPQSEIEKQWKPCDKCNMTEDGCSNYK